MPTKKRPRKAVGRPSEVDRAELLDAAEELLALEGYEGMTLRGVASRADCNPALISYHFGGKEGLYRAVLLRHFSGLKGVLNEAATPEPCLAREWPEIQDPAERRFCASLNRLVRAMTCNPRMQKVLCREMMAGAPRMVSTLAGSESSAFRLLSELIRSFQNEGALKQDFDIRYVVLSLVSPVVYSLIAAPLIRDIYGIAKLDEAYMRTLCVHQTRTLFEGWGTRKR